MKCDKCGETLFTTIIKVGSSIAALLPKKVKEYGIKEGVVDSVKVLSSNSLEIKFGKDIV